MRTFSRRTQARKAAPKEPTLPAISIIIPAHNEAATIAKTVRAALRQQYPRFEVLLIDDRSTDGTAEAALAAARGDRRFRVLRNPKNLGLAGSLNRGIARSRSPLVCTLHADCVPQGHQWLRSLAAAVLASPRCAAATTNQAVPRSTFSHLSLTEKLLTGSSLEGAPPLPLGPVRTVNNKGDLYRKAALRAVGGFGSAHFRVAGEDHDLSLRLRAAGWSLALAPGMLFHLEGSHSRGPRAFFKKQLQYSEARGALRLRTLTAAERLATVPILVVGDLCSIVGFLRGLVTGRQRF